MDKIAHDIAISLLWACIRKCVKCVGVLTTWQATCSIGHLGDNC